MNWDTTLFSLADSNYHIVVKSLLQATSWPCLSSAELVTFQTDYAGTAFLCPIKGCHRSCVGYASAAELNDHKTRRHTQRLRCYQGKCVYNDVGFLKESTLRQHIQKVHKKAVPQIPATLKRKRETEDPGLAPLSDNLPELPPADAPSEGTDSHKNPIPGPEESSPAIRMFRPEQMRNIPRLSTEEKVRYETGLRQLWAALASASPGSPQQREAQKTIMDFSNQLIKKVQKDMPDDQAAQDEILIKKVQKHMPDDQAAQDEIAQPRSQRQPQLSGPPNIQIQQHIEAMSWIAPPEVVEQGPEAATEWSATNKDKYTRAMLQMHSTTERLRSNENLAKALQKKGAKLTPEEGKSLQEIQSQKPQIIKAYQDAKRFVVEFRKAQAERRAVSQAKDG